MKLSDLGELGLLARLQPYLQADLRDDVAVWPEPDGAFTVATCDTFAEGRHFDLSTMTPEDAGWRACALTLADLAAKNARPVHGLVALTAPAATDAATVEGLYRGLSECARKYGLKLVGGDTTAGDALALTVFALGTAGALPVPRSAARAGWLVGVTGPLGAPPLRPEPRWWAGGGAAGDISDGLLREIAKYGLGADIESARIPIAQGATLEQALTSGEEVELIVATPEPLDGLAIVGRFTDGPVRVDGVERSGGYDHFS